MSSVITRSVDFIATSDPNVGAIGVSNDGSTFSFRIQNSDGFNISKNVKNVELSLIGSEVWYNTPNITETNNKFYFSYTGQDYDITLPTGLYSPEQLDKTLRRLISDEINEPDQKFFTLGVDDASQSIIVEIKNDGDRVYFDEPNTFRDLLGFSPQTLTASRSKHNFASDLRATFSDLNYYLIQSDMCTEGIMINGIYDNIVAKIQIDAHANEQNLFAPSHPASVDCTERMKGNKNREFRFSLLDNKLNRVDTRGEIYSLHLRLNITELVTQN